LLLVIAGVLAIRDQALFECLALGRAQGPIGRRRHGGKIGIRFLVALLQVLLVDALPFGIVLGETG
jgi:hypothetical protein